MLESLPSELLNSPEGRRAAWVLETAAAVASGGSSPDADALGDQYTHAWLFEVPVAATLLEAGELVVSATAMRVEPGLPGEARVLLDVPDRSSIRFRCVVEKAAPHRIAFQLFSPAVDPSTYVERVVRRDSRSVHIRDFGGTGPLLLLWHGAGCDGSVWEAMVPHFEAFRVIAQDLPSHGRSPIDHFSVAEAVADGQAVVADLGLGDPVLVGHSMGGWAAMHFAATNPCRALICLDGPTCLEYSSMALGPQHRAFVPDPPDVLSDLAALVCPTLILLSRGTSQPEQEWMVPFRTGLADYLTTHHSCIQLEWRSAGHLILISEAEQTADLVTQFLKDTTP